MALYVVPYTCVVIFYFLNVDPKCEEFKDIPTSQKLCAGPLDN